MEGGDGPVGRTPSSFGPSLSAAVKEAPSTKVERQSMPSAALLGSEISKGKKGNERQSRSGRGTAQQRTQPPQSVSRSPNTGRRAQTSGQGVAANLNSKAETRDESDDVAVPTKAGSEEWEIVTARKPKPSMVATITTATAASAPASTFVPKDAGVLKMDMGHGPVKTLLHNGPFHEPAREH